MKRLFALLLSFALLTIAGCSRGITSVSIEKKIREYQNKLQDTENRLYELPNERKEYQNSFLQIIYGKGLTPKEIIEEFKIKDSRHNAESWFMDAKYAWKLWESCEKSIVIFTRQKERLEKDLKHLNFAYKMVKHNEKDKKVYIRGEDPELDIIMATSEIAFDMDRIEKELSEAEQAEISNQVNQTMMKTIEENTSRGAYTPPLFTPRTYTYNKGTLDNNDTHFVKEDISNGSFAGERIVKIIKGVEFAFRWCPAGTFMMGSPKDEKDRFSNEVQHKVTLTKGFWMLETEVTQKQWKAVMGTNPSYFKGDYLPVEKVSWVDCQEFCKKCAELGFPVQLPTEAQWEYACRAGSTGTYAGDLNEMAWYGFNSGSKTQPVGTKKPNAWGLYDMHGNVWEWCQDWCGDYPNGGVIDPVGPSSGSNLVDRGGGWNGSARFCRSAYRDDCDPGCRSDYLGFRLVRCQ